jgi:putative restriction endonuclease
LSPLFAEAHALSGTTPEPSPSPTVQEDEFHPTPGRSAAFARIIREAYDYQCAACGLRIRLENDLTFIDAAHLIPFGQSFNDHPTNGIALCKNHHWAMDRHLLAPSTERIWKVATTLDPRRSPGEAEILALAGKALLLPRDEAYHPDPAALRWREERVR